MKNKTLLHVLLVLTFIYAGMSCLSGLMMAAMQPMLIDFYAANRTLFPEEFYTMTQRFFEIPRGYFAVSGLLYALELLGAVLMWNLRRSGFHCYTLARLLLLLVPLLFLGKGYLGLGEVMMAALFIFVYWMLMKQLGAFSTDGAKGPEKGENLPEA